MMESNKLLIFIEKITGNKMIITINNNKFDINDIFSISNIKKGFYYDDEGSYAESNIHWDKRKKKLMFFNIEFYNNKLLQIPQSENVNNETFIKEYDNLIILWNNNKTDIPNFKF